MDKNSIDKSLESYEKEVYNLKQQLSKITKSNIIIALQEFVGLSNNIPSEEFDELAEEIIKNLKK